MNGWINRFTQCIFRLREVGSPWKRCLEADKKESGCERMKGRYKKKSL